MNNVIKNTVKIMGTVLALSALSTAAFANSYEQICKLGETCSIANHIGSIKLPINKDSGGNYKCTFTLPDNKSFANRLLSVNITGGKAFTIGKGWGPHVITVSPSVIDIAGYFAPDLTEGEIVITKIVGSGTVNCINS